MEQDRTSNLLLLSRQARQLEHLLDSEPSRDLLAEYESIVLDGCEGPLDRISTAYLSNLQIRLSSAIAVHRLARMSEVEADYVDRYPMSPATEARAACEAARPFDGLANSGQDERALGLEITGPGGACRTFGRRPSHFRFPPKKGARC